MIYEGKAKKVIPLGEQQVKIEFKDDLTAFDGEKKATMESKGALNRDITAKLFELLANHGIPTHMIKKEGKRTLICKKVKIFPIEIVVRNYATGSFIRRYGVPEQEFQSPLIELFLKSDELHDPLITEAAAIQLGLIKREQLEIVKLYAIATNKILMEFFASKNVYLVDFKLEFGVDSEGNILVADEITPDSMRLWKIGIKGDEKVLDKDRFRKDLGNVLEAYREVLQLVTDAEEFRTSFTLELILNVELKEHVKDPKGEVTQRALKRLGCDFVERVRLGKLIRLQLKRSLKPDELAELNEAIRRFLINPLVERVEMVVVE